MKTPKSIQKALETIAGFCNKHQSCDELRFKPPCYWADEEEPDDP